MGSLSVGVIPSYFAFLLLGKLCIYLLQKFPLAKSVADRTKFTKELFGCDLCLGVWVFTFLSLVLRVYIFGGYILFLSELFTGAISSFVMHLISLGWNVKFRVIEVIDAPK